MLGSLLEIVRCVKSVNMIIQHILGYSNLCQFQKKFGLISHLEFIEELPKSRGKDVIFVVVD